MVVVGGGRQGVVVGGRQVVVVGGGDWEESGSVLQVQAMARVEVVRMPRRQHGVQIPAQQNVTVFQRSSAPPYSSSSTGLSVTAPCPVPSKPTSTTVSRRGTATGLCVEKEKEGTFLGGWRWEDRGSLEVADAMRRGSRTRARVKEDGMVAGDSSGV